MISTLITPAVAYMPPASGSGYDNMPPMNSGYYKPAGSGYMPPMDSYMPPMDSGHHKPAGSGYYMPPASGSGYHMPAATAGSGSAMHAPATYGSGHHMPAGSGMEEEFEKTTCDTELRTPCGIQYNVVQNMVTDDGHAVTYEMIAEFEEQLEKDFKPEELDELFPMLGKLMMEGDGAEVQAFAENIMGEEPNPAMALETLHYATEGPEMYGEDSGYSQETYDHYMPNGVDHMMPPHGPGSAMDSGYGAKTEDSMPPMDSGYGSAMKMQAPATYGSGHGASSGYMTGSGYSMADTANYFNEKPMGSGYHAGSYMPPMPPMDSGYGHTAGSYMPPMPAAGSGYHAGSYMPAAGSGYHTGSGYHGGSN